MSNIFEPGMFVTLAGAPDWGVGQVQCVVGSRVTVNFEHAGKRLINVANARLRPVPQGSDNHQEQSAT
jgi:hypothetical protein